MSEQVNVVAILTPAPGKKDRVVELLKQLVKEVQGEDGILQYDLFWTEEAGEVVFVEKYASQSVVKTHMATPHFKGFGKSLQAEGLLAKPPALKWLSPVVGLASKL
ncbi:hypothetical protein BU16DRAFT_545078 [Lophium mytilinum]|uniref:ABM domain-containing protein n=1 Tax=Lophium mytilinum TaxID=390894 RepID=A0A6A6QA94_9PEZI|nr:hypothetical protein BU16DRAFT_545078 [Lophium mytilinum]